MKLISCYIENFGGLSRYALDFSQGVTVIEEPNGFGKTTLAEFIRAMFYGFPRKAKTLEKSKRQKYTPWNGGKFGGNLVFGFEGKQYRLERTFGTTPRGDSFSLIDLTTNRKSDRFSEEIGLELFQLDGDSFERSTYLPQIHEGMDLTTAGIQAKLTDLVEDTNDLGNFDKAMAALKASRSGFVPYRGSGGSVAEAAKQISAAQQELDRAVARKAQLEACNGEIAELEEKISQGKRDLEEARKQWEQASERSALRGRYADYKERHDAARAEVRRLEGAYPMGIPGDRELEDARNLAEKLAVLEESALDPQECQQYEKLRSIRDGGLLEEERLDALAEQNRELLCRRAALEQMTVTEEDRQEMARLNGVFAAGMPGDAQLDRCRELLDRCDALREENRRLAQSRKKAVLWPVILGIVILIAGFFVPGGFRYALLGGGAAVLTGGLLWWSRSDRRNRAVREEMERNEATITEYEKTAESFVRPLSSVVEPGAALEEIRRNVAAARALQEKLRLQKEKQEAQSQGVQLLEGELRSQLGAGDFDRAIANLRLAREKLLQWESRESRRQENLGVYNGQLERFLARFGLVREEDLRRQLQRIYDDSRNLEQARTQMKELARQLEQFPEIPEEAADPEEMKRRQRELETELSGLTEKLLRQRQLGSELRRDADRIPEIWDGLEFWQEKRNGDQQKARILDDTMAFLQDARDSLTTSYLGPIRESFHRYLEKLTQVTGEKVFISPELDVQLERFGQARELGYFSAGQTDTVMLCMRLALVDALFGDVKPFVILDDPFVNLDDDRTAKALDLLRELGRERQIIYLTCNSSRSL